MVRILHVAETDADFQTQRCVDDLSRQLGEGFACQHATIGRGGTWRHAAGAILGIRSRVDVDVVHAWGAKALSACMAAHVPVIHCPPPAPTERSIRWLWSMMAYRPVHVVCATDTQRRLLAGVGIDPNRMGLIRPAVDFSRVRKKKNPELRQALGLADDDFVLLAVGESTHEAAHKDALWAAGILRVYDPHYRLLIWGRGDRHDEVARFNEKLIDPQLLCIAEQRLGSRVELEELFGAADMAIISASGHVAPLPICIAMASGVPMVATATPEIGELLEDRHTALMVRPGSPRELAQRILKLREDSSLRWKLADAARAEAYEYFSMARFVSEWRELYRSVAAPRTSELGTRT